MRFRERFLAVLILAIAWTSGGASTAEAALCDSCFTYVDACCGKLPQIVDGAYTAPTRGLIGTRRPDPSSGNACVTLFDITQNMPVEGNDWSGIGRYNGPGGSWNVANLGTVFGVTLDQHGNAYVCHTSCYSSDAVGTGGAGAIYRIDASTGAITTFAVLQNFSDPNLTAPNDKPGLGNISYDCDNDQFFVTNLEDGRIYRIKSTNPLNASPATVLETFDPGAADDGQPGFAPYGERLWAVQWHANRVYYGVWASPFDKQTIRSVGLFSGAFVWSSDRHEIVLPLLGATSSSPISDISFGPGGTMVIAERTMTSSTVAGAHGGRVLEYQCAAAGAGWAPANGYAVGQPSTNETAGGIDWDYALYGGPSPPASAPPGHGGSQGRVWATADAIHTGAPYGDVIYGIQGLRPGGGSITNSLLIDSDGNTAATEDGFLGDVEVGCPNGLVAVEDEIESGGALAWVTPTPWRGAGSLRFLVSRAGMVSAALYDVRGRAVRTLIDRRWTPAGRHEVSLDGRDETGRRLPSGVYLYRVTTPEHEAAGRFVIVR